MKHNNSHLVSRLRIDDNGWLNQPNCISLSSNSDSRPDACDIEVIIVHAISLPLGKYSTGDPEKLFTNTLNCSSDTRFSDLEGLKVSAHFLIERSGRVLQFVSTNERAWHAGVSCCLGRENVNDFSVGIEVEGCDFESFTRIQYRQLAHLIRGIRWRYPKISKTNCFSHAEIAPGRKTDPGPFFDWTRLTGLL